MEDTFTLIINHGKDKAFESIKLEKKDFLQKIPSLWKEPKKVFLGLGDFLEIGDYSTLMDNIFFDTGGIKLENILDDNNRRISLEGNIPYSFFKLAVYFPDFLLKNVPTSCVSVIGEKSRLFPGAEMFIQHVKAYNPLILTAMPFEIAIEFVKRVGLGESNLVSTEYWKKKDTIEKEVYAGDVMRFISGDRKSQMIEKYMLENNLGGDDVVYIGRGEAGVKTFSSVNSIAFDPFRNIIPESRITLYGSSLISLLVLFNFNGKLDSLVQSDFFDEYMPSLVVHSTVKEKSDELIDIEVQHQNMQRNIMGQRVEHSGVSYKSVEREIDVVFAGSSINIHQVKQMVTDRMQVYKNNPGELVKKIYDMALVRYKNFCAV